MFCLFVCFFHTSKQLLNFSEWFILNLTWLKVQTQEYGAHMQVYVFLLFGSGSVTAVLRI